jgi:hypothetical protein
LSSSSFVLLHGVSVSVLRHSPLRLPSVLRLLSCGCLFPCSLPVAVFPLRSVRVIVLWLEVVPQRGCFPLHPPLCLRAVHFSCEGVPVRPQAPPMLCPVAPGLLGQAARIWHRGYGGLCPGHVRGRHQAREVVSWRGVVLRRAIASWPPFRPLARSSRLFRFPPDSAAAPFPSCASSLSFPSSASVLFPCNGRLPFFTCPSVLFGALLAGAPVESLLHCGPKRRQGCAFGPQPRCPDPLRLLPDAPPVTAKAA